MEIVELGMAIIFIPEPAKAFSLIVCILFGIVIFVISVQLANIPRGMEFMPSGILTRDSRELAETNLTI